MKNKWETKKLGDVCKIINGSTPLRSKKEYWEDGDINWFTIKDIRSQGRQIRYTGQKITKKALKDSSINLLPPDTVLICCTASVGEWAISKIKLTTNQQFNGMIARDKTELLPEYLFYFSSTLKDKLYSLSGKTTIDFISMTKLKGIEISYPSLEEQKQIVKILNEFFDSISKSKENAEKNLKNAKELFESYLEETFSNPGEDWEEKKLNQISDNLDNQRIPITKNVRVNGSIPYYGASGIVDHVKEYIFDEDLLLVSEDGANLLARTYPIAFSISGRTWVNNHAHVLRFKERTTQKLVELYLNSIRLDNFVSGMAQPKLNQTMLNKIPIPIPSLKEQKTIVSKLDALSKEIKELETIYSQKVKNLDELKKSILRKAFSGELMQ